LSPAIFENHYGKTKLPFYTHTQKEEEYEEVSRKKLI